MPGRAAILDLFLLGKNRQTGDLRNDMCVDVTQLGGRPEPSVAPQHPDPPWGATSKLEAEQPRV